ncbi:hypothetical protein [Rhodanobacter glycinis]|nr:hypothetical protein [Rhodanobacter glycinis]
MTTTEDRPPSLAQPFMPSMAKAQAYNIARARHWRLPINCRADAMR